MFICMWKTFSKSQALFCASSFFLCISICVWFQQTFNVIQFAKKDLSKREAWWRVNIKTVFWNSPGPNLMAFEEELHVSVSLWLPPRLLRLRLTWRDMGVSPRHLLSCYWVTLSVILAAACADSLLRLCLHEENCTCLQHQVSDSSRVSYRCFGF